MAQWTQFRMEKTKCSHWKWQFLTSASWMICVVVMYDHCWSICFVAIATKHISPYAGLLTQLPP